MDTTYIADLPAELIYQLLEEMDFPTIRRFCRSSAQFKKLCETPYFRRLILKKRNEYAKQEEAFVEHVLW